MPIPFPAEPWNFLVMPVDARSAWDLLVGFWGTIFFSTTNNQHFMTMEIGGIQSPSQQVTYNENSGAITISLPFIVGASVITFRSPLNVFAFAVRGATHRFGSSAAVRVASDDALFWTLPASSPLALPKAAPYTVSDSVANTPMCDLNTDSSGNITVTALAGFTFVAGSLQWTPPSAQNWPPLIEWQLQNAAGQTLNFFGAMNISISLQNGGVISWAFGGNYDPIGKKRSRKGPAGDDDVWISSANSIPIDVPRASAGYA